MVEQRWHAVVGDVRLAIVAGDVWIAGNIAFYGADRPSVFIDADPAKSPWITAGGAGAAGGGADLAGTEGAAGVARRVSRGAAAAADRIALCAAPWARTGPVRWAIVRPVP